MKRKKKYKADAEEAATVDPSDDSFAFLETILKVLIFIYFF